jgi:hypothetical protein
MPSNKTVIRRRRPGRGVTVAILARDMNALAAARAAWLDGVQDQSHLSPEERVDATLRDMATYPRTVVLQ